MTSFLRKAISQARAPRYAAVQFYAALCLLISNLGLSPAFAQTQQTAEPEFTANPALQSLSTGLAELYQEVAPSVVVIQAWPNEGKDETGADRRDLPLAERPNEGSGFIISAQGHVYTNAHVVEGGGRIDIRLFDGREFQANLIGLDPFTDVAVIKILGNAPEETWKPARLGDSDTVKVGQIVGAIGAPYNLEFSFSLGCVSGIGRTSLGLAAYEDYIQTDASINPGNSGGPLFNLDGEVIGMNTLINGLNRGLGFAIPINLTHEVGQNLLTEGRVVRPWLGVQIRSLRDMPRFRRFYPDLQGGVLVTAIEADAPAYRSDLRAEDVIIGVDGVAVQSSADLQREVLRRRVGQTLQLQVHRAGNTVIIPVVAGELSTQGAIVERSTVAPSLGVFGIAAEDITPQLAAALKLSQTHGVMVSDVIPGSIGGLADIRAGDILLSIDGEEVESSSSLEIILGKVNWRKGVVIEVLRGEEKLFTVLRDQGEALR